MKTLSILVLVVALSLFMVEAKPAPKVLAPEQDANEGYKKKEPAQEDNDEPEQKENDEGTYEDDPEEENAEDSYKDEPEQEENDEDSYEDEPEQKENDESEEALQDAPGPQTVETLDYNNENDEFEEREKTFDVPESDEENFEDETSEVENEEEFNDRRGFNLGNIGASIKTKASKLANTAATKGKEAIDSAKNKVFSDEMEEDESEDHDKEDLEKEIAQDENAELFEIIDQENE